MKTYLLIALWFLIIVICITLSMWLWWYADCETIKTWNFNAPGRCIQ